MSIDNAKRRRTGKLKFLLRNATVYESQEGYHFTDYLDKTESISQNIVGDTITDEKIRYIESSLQSNAERFSNQVILVRRFVQDDKLNGMKLLDVGSGGGLFLDLMRREGAEVLGIELNDDRAFYASNKYRLPVVKIPLDDEEYWGERKETFDVVTFWDVIEHVNYPQETINSAATILKSGGLICMDTPCKDSFYYKFGELSYFLSGGRAPTFLNIMYSSHPFGHKQIFSVKELEDSLQRSGFDVLYVRKFHELSFPIQFYLNKLFRSEKASRVIEPVIRVLLSVFRIRNKVAVVARKRAATGDLWRSGC